MNGEAVHKIRREIIDENDVCWEKKWMEVVKEINTGWEAGGKVITKCKKSV